MKATGTFNPRTVETCSVVLTFESLVGTLGSQRLKNLFAFILVLFQWHFGLPLYVEPTFSVIYNSIRYDDTTHVVTFHLREKDWDLLKSNAWMWIASSDLIPVIKREPIFLGGEAVETTGGVDPVEKFGLFSVQTFAEAESDDACEILKVGVGYPSNKTGKAKHVFFRLYLGCTE